MIVLRKGNEDVIKKSQNPNSNDKRGFHNKNWAP